jgi:hypothetical protein
VVVQPSSNSNKSGFAIIPYFTTSANPERSSRPESVCNVSTSIRTARG